MSTYKNYNDRYIKIVEQELLLVKDAVLFYLHSSALSEDDKSDIVQDIMLLWTANCKDRFAKDFMMLIKYKTLDALRKTKQERFEQAAIKLESYIGD